MEIKGYSIKDVYLKLVQEILDNGEEIESERGKVKELMNVLVSIDSPFENNFLGNNIDEISIPNDCFWKGEQLHKYVEEFTSPDIMNFVYTYGNRYLKHFGVNEIDLCIDKLKNNSLSRRAVAITFDPRIDYRIEDIPCLNHLSFQVRDSKLHSTYTYRSWDAYGASFPNLVGLSSLSAYVADKVDVSVGKIVLHGINSHIYSTDYDSARKLLESNKP